MVLLSSIVIHNIFKLVDFWVEEIEKFAHFRWNFLFVLFHVVYYFILYNDCGDYAMRLCGLSRLFVAGLLGIEIGSKVLYVNPSEFRSKNLICFSLMQELILRYSFDNLFFINSQKQKLVTQICYLILFLIPNFLEFFLTRFWLKFWLPKPTIWRTLCYF